MCRKVFGQSVHRRAFTLIELVVVLAILSLLLLVAVPKVGAVYDRQLVEEQAELLEKDLSWLRSEAKRSGSKTVFQCSAEDYILTTAGGGQKKTLLSKRLTLAANTSRGRIVFEPRGTAFEKCTVIISCGKEKRSVVVSNLGRIRVGVPT